MASHDAEPNTGPCAIVMLGAAVWADGVPSPTLKRRAEHAAGLFQSTSADWLVLCGGIGRHPPSEASVAADICAATGVPKTALLLDETSKTTLQNIENAASLLATKGCSSIVIVTDYYHLPRAVMTSRILGLRATGSYPRHNLRQTSARRQLKSLLRESIALPYYLVRATLKRWF